MTHVLIVIRGVMSARLAVTAALGQHQMVRRANVVMVAPVVVTMGNAPAVLAHQRTLGIPVQTRMVAAVRVPEVAATPVIHANVLVAKGRSTCMQVAVVMVKITVR